MTRRSNIKQSNAGENKNQFDLSHQTAHKNGDVRAAVTLSACCVADATFT
jgi:hypothetical protein